jgi:ribose transport system ATP-binding protein
MIIEHPNATTVLQSCGVPLLELRGISKSFPGVKALQDVSFSVWPGEVHMLLGENGAGKSTLMKVLCGAHQADEGAFLHRGEPVRIMSPTDARKLGIAVIFQEFSLVPYLDIADNIFLGRAPRGRIPGTLDRRLMLDEARRVLDLLGMDIDPRTKVHQLGIAQQQMVEIAKALSQNAGILVMDEPTAALSERESEQLFRVMARLKTQGVAIVYISHRMAEVFALGDRITVLRDGQRIRSLLPHEASPDALVQMMVGRSVDMTYPRHFGAPGETLLEISGLSAASGIRDIALTVRAGEIVGLCGLVGSGRTEVARAIFGADPITSGEVRVFGRIHHGGPEAAARLGVALIPESRKTEGLALNRSVADNIVSAGLPKLFSFGVFHPSRAREIARDIIARLSIATAGTQVAVGTLSGGNQQKVALAKWLTHLPRVLVLSEPTRGMDVGAKDDVVKIVRGLRAQGIAIVVVSTEPETVLSLADRILVMKKGSVVREFAGEPVSKDRLLEAA